MPAKCKVGKAAGPSKSAKQKCKKGSVLRDENTSEHCSERVVDSKQVLLKEMTAIGKEYKPCTLLTREMCCCSVIYDKI